MYIIVVEIVKGYKKYEIFFYQKKNFLSPKILRKDIYSRERKSKCKTLPISAMLK